MSALVDKIRAPHKAKLETVATVSPGNFTVLMI